MKTKRSRLSVGYLMRVLLVLLVAGNAVWLVPTVSRARKVSRFEAIGGQIEYDEREGHHRSLPVKGLFGDDANKPVRSVLLRPTEALNDEDLTLLTEFTEVTTVCLDGGHITDDVMQYVAQLPRLKCLLLSSTSVTAHGFAQLDGVDSLESLNLGDVTVTDDMLKSFGVLSNLRRLGFINCRFQSADFRHLAGLPHLGAFAIMDSSVDEQVRNLDKLQALETLFLFNVPFTDADCEQFSDMPYLKSLRINGTQISDAGVRHLTGLQSLEFLHLQGASITDDGLVHLAELQRLEELDLGGTNVSDDGLVHLGELPGLKHLNLSETNVSDDGLVHLAGLQRLGHLDLSDTNVSDDGLVHLGELKKLEWLWLSRTQVSNAGLKQIASFESLFDVALDDTKVTADGLAMVRNDVLSPSGLTVRAELIELFPTSSDVH